MNPARGPGRPALWTVLGPAVAVLLTACAADKPDTPAATTARAAASAPASVSPSPSPSATTPATTPTSAGPVTRKPKDGKRLAACSDAACEVEVERGDVIRLNTRAMRKAGFGDLTVRSIRKKEVVFDLASGTWTYTQPGPKGAANLNGVSLTLVRIDGERAVIRLGKPIKGELTIRLGPDGMTMMTTGE